MSKSTGGCREGIIKGKTLRYGAPPPFQLWSQSHGDMLFSYNEKKGTYRRVFYVPFVICGGPKESM